MVCMTHTWSRAPVKRVMSAEKSPALTLCHSSQLSQGTSLPSGMPPMGPIKLLKNLQ